MVFVAEAAFGVTDSFVAAAASFDKSEKMALREKSSQQSPTLTPNKKVLHQVLRYKNIYINFLKYI